MLNQLIFDRQETRLMQRPTEHNDMPGLEFSLMYNYDPETFANRYFMFLHREAPNTFSVERVNLVPVREGLAKLFPNITQQCRYEQVSKQTPERQIAMEWLLVADDIFLLLETMHDNETKAKVLYGKNANAKLLEPLKQLLEKNLLAETVERKIYLLCKGYRGLELNAFSINNQPISIDQNYNDSFSPIDALIRKRLSEPYSKGIVLLHGKPGTGKTTYIRYLIQNINKRLIYIPTNLTDELSSPAFLPLLAENPNSVLIIEDAENVIQQRSGGGNAAVSNLLNLADGLLSDCLNIQLLCTFNTELHNVDNALLRKGRLIASYHFDALEKKKAQELSNGLGFKSTIHSSMTLAEIYNQEDLSFAVHRSGKIGY